MIDIGIEFMILVAFCLGFALCAILFLTVLRKTPISCPKCRSEDFIRKAPIKGMGIFVFVRYKCNSCGYTTERLV